MAERKPRNGTATTSKLPTPPVAEHAARTNDASPSIDVAASQVTIHAPTESVDDDTRRIVRAIYEEIRAAKFDQIADDKIRDELAKLLSLLPDIVRIGDPYMAYAAEVSLVTLLAPDSNSRVAQAIREDLERRIGEDRRRQAPPAFYLIVGLAGFLYAIPALIFVLFTSLVEGDVLSGTILGVPAGPLVAVLVAGSIGAIVSLLVRLDQFSTVESAQARRVSAMILVVTGFTKPLVGAAFAAFLYSAIASGMVPISVEEGSESFFYLALGFLAGFSERLVPDIASSTAEVYAGAAVKG